MSTEAKQPATAVYKQIEAGLRRKIADSVWPTGMMLPGRRDLAREYGVSTVTVERAISKLVADGLLRADDRRGTFVALSNRTSLDAAISDSGRREPAILHTQTMTRPLTVGIVATLYEFNEGHLALNNFWVRLMIQSLEQAFSEDGETTRFVNRIPAEGGSKLSIREAIQRAMEDGVDALALIAFSSSPADVDDALGAMPGHDGRSTIPIVCITSGELQRPVPHVFVDNRSGGYQAAQHLIRQGCKSLIYLAPFQAPWSADRQSGIHAAAAHAGLAAGAVSIYPETAPPPWVNEDDPAELGYAAACDLLAGAGGNLLAPGVGVVCVNDGVAFGFLRALEEMRPDLAGSVMVIGFDDHFDSRSRQLTTMRPAIESLGQEAARLLRQSLLQRTPDSLQVRLRWRLITRASTQSLPAGRGEQNVAPQGETRR